MAAKIKTGNCRNRRNRRNSEPPGNIKTKSSLGDEDNDNPATFSVADREDLRRRLGRLGRLRKIEIQIVIALSLQQYEIIIIELSKWHEKKRFVTPTEAVISEK